MPNGDDEEREVTVGLLADPGLPTELATALVDELPGALSDRVSDQVRWRVHVRSEPLTLNEHGKIPLVQNAREKRSREGWDLMVCLTDLPRQVGHQPIIGEFNAEHRVALASLPAIGSFRLRKHLRDTVVYLLDALIHGTGLPGPARDARGRPKRGPAELMSPVRHLSNPDRDIDESITLTGLRGRVRLLLGMVRDNRPWRLVPSLSSALAAAMASAAFGVFFSTIWTLADALSVGRLTLISLLSVTTMVTWLIIYNGLWERPRAQEWRGQPVLYNLATVLTLFVGVAGMYMLLFAIVLVAAHVVIASSYMESQLGHPATFTSYVKLTWLASSMGIAAGALGSSLESEDAVRQATYSKRERERRERRKQQEAEERQQEQERTTED
ncbi:hypothetical protein [Qaidamihabitans albus]|uniref:hypothetical protein n=1 Tax=Qaidamihabitans albus TaxID=2795733 RepID=UPI0018F1CD25|nr:hypothetical protein [Qaidamihabitans albus]